ncbi:hypothetical protein GF389_05270, partial [Candidatus Dojkabacteria bacterium]|nr:hypothetical protein [Candidatus Dojkabacteria bacterium]
IFPEIPKRWKELHQRALKGEVLQEDKDKFERADGSVNWLRWYIAPWEIRKGEIGGIIMFTEVINDEVEKQKKLEDLNELRSKFITIISHQLRTPLTSIKWNLESIVNEDLGKLDKALQKSLNDTYEVSSEIVNRLSSLLELIDMEEGKLNLKKEKTSLKTLIQSVMDEYKGQVKRKKLSVKGGESKMAGTKIEADREKIFRVIEQYMKNAIEYSDEGSEVNISVTKNKDKIRFVIENIGDPIPKDEHDKIYTKFFRGSNAFSKETDRYGIGLYLSKGYVEAHGGTVGFTSKEKERLNTFWFEIPVV